MAIEQTAVRLIVHGYVQGVGFRYFTSKNASRIGVVGWVRNAYDGTVEIRAEGTKSKLKRFINRVEQGPSHAKVTKVDIDWRPSTGKFHSFNIRH